MVTKIKIISTLILALLLHTHLPAQTAIPLDAALKSIATDLANKIPAKTNVAIINFEADTKTLSDYIIEELWTHFAASGRFVMIDRKNFAAIESELNFQAGGAISDASAQSIGKMLGPQTIVYGKIAKLGHEFRITVYATQVEKALSEVQTRNVASDTRIEALLGGADTALLDARIRHAVGELAQRKQTSVGMGRINLQGTYTVTNLSDFLKNSIVYEMSRQSDKFKVGGNAMQATIEGSFAPLGRDAEVTLNLVSTARDKKVLASSKFIIPAAELGKRSLSVLPPKGDAFISQNEFDAKQKALEPYAEKNNVLTLAPDHPDALYHDGDYMSFTITAARDCYFKITHVDVDGNLQVIYPLGANDNNFLKAGIARVIPDNNRFRMSKPFGEEYILVAAYDKPFNQKQSGAVRLDAAIVTRGLIVEPENTAPQASASELKPVATSMFSYTILP